MWPQHRFITVRECVGPESHLARDRRHKIPTPKPETWLWPAFGATGTDSRCVTCASVSSVLNVTRMWPQHRFITVRECVGPESHLARDRRLKILTPKPETWLWPAFGATGTDSRCVTCASVSSVLNVTRMWPQHRSITVRECVGPESHLARDDRPKIPTPDPKTWV
jgi:hypothetical protein